MQRNNRAALLLLATLILPVSACAPAGGAEQPMYLRAMHAEATAAPSTTGQAGIAPSQGSENLRDGLLAAGDVPNGYGLMAVVDSQNGQVSVGGGNFPGCPALEPMTTSDTSAAAVSYAAGAIGPYLTHAVVKFPAGGAVKAMESLRSTVTSCTSFEQQLAGISVKFSLAAIDVPADLKAVSEDAVALRMTGTTDVGISVTADIVAARRGEYVIWLNDTTVGSAAAGIASKLAATAADRCGKTLKGC